MTSIIGLSTMTESSAVYIEDGEVSIGIEEERLTRKNTKEASLIIRFSIFYKKKINLYMILIF